MAVSMDALMNAESISNRLYPYVRLALGFRSPTLFAAVDPNERLVRLVGVTVSNLSDNAFQLSLEDRWREVALDDAVDRVRARYGKRALGLAASTITPVFHSSHAVSQALPGMC